MNALKLPDYVFNGTLDVMGGLCSAMSTFTDYYAPFAESLRNYELAKKTPQMIPHVIDFPFKNALKFGAGNGALFGAVLSAMDNFEAVVNGKKTKGEAGLDLVLDIGAAAVTGAVSSVAMVGFVAGAGVLAATTSVALPTALVGAGAFLVGMGVGLAVGQACDALREVMGFPEQPTFFHDFPFNSSVEVQQNCRC